MLYRYIIKKKLQLLTFLFCEFVSMKKQSYMPCLAVCSLAFFMRILVLVDESGLIDNGAWLSRENTHGQVGIGQLNDCYTDFFRS